jgi:hypothetical protein
MNIHTYSLLAETFLTKIIPCGNFWINGKAMGLLAKFQQINLNCSLSSNKMAKVVNFNDFKQIGNVRCKSEFECKMLHRLSNVILKRYYINDFGGPAIPKFAYSDILPMYGNILYCMRQPSQSPNLSYLNLMDMIEKHYRPSNITEGNVYIIDNITSIKVGASSNAITRFRRLKAKGQINSNARLVWVYDVADMYGFEAKAQALLNQWKTQNPLYANNRTAGWRNAGRTLFVFIVFG